MYIRMFTIKYIHHVQCTTHRLYDAFTGEFVWNCDEHEGPEVRLLAPPLFSQWVGLCGGSGLWLLRSRRLSEQTHLLAHGLFPVTTNADEVIFFKNLML